MQRRALLAEGGRCRGPPKAAPSRQFSRNHKVTQHGGSRVKGPRGSISEHGFLLNLVSMHIWHDQSPHTHSIAGTDCNAGCELHRRIIRLNVQCSPMQRVIAVIIKGTSFEKGIHRALARYLQACCCQSRKRCGALCSCPPPRPGMPAASQLPAPGRHRPLRKPTGAIAAFSSARYACL